MLAHAGPVTVFWPSNAPSSQVPGVVIGWKNSDVEFFVLTVLEAVESRSVENALRLGVLFRNNQHPVSQLFDLCHISSLHVLGWTNPPEPPASLDAAHFCAYTRPGSRFPVIQSPLACRCTLQIILYQPPRPARMQYLSLDPIPLALGATPERQASGGGGLPGSDISGSEDVRERDRKRKLVAKLRLHSVRRPPALRTHASLLVVLNQINCAFEMSHLVRSNAGLIGTRPKRSLSMSERVVESASTLHDYVMAALWQLVVTWLYPVVRRSFVLGLVAHRVIAEFILRVLEFRLRPDYAALKDISATAQQVDIRLQQFCYWPFQYLTLRRRRDVWDSVTESHPEYIRFYNSLWLVANDVIIGIAVGLYAMDHSQWLAQQINSALNQYTVDGLRRVISWLMDWPAGLKLNNELAAFLGDMFLWVIDYWAGCVAGFGSVLPHVVYLIGVSGFAGATMPISLCSDLLSALTVHVYCFYVAAARLYDWQLTTLISLFHLFRGKKRNVLRNRIDSCDYELDQLLLGTILFTLLFFLLPTVAVFYLAFAFARMLIISLKAALDTALACLNHFPLFALMLRLKEPRRLPGGIRFELDPKSFHITSHYRFRDHHDHHDHHHYNSDAGNSDYSPPYHVDDDDGDDDGDDDDDGFSDTDNSQNDTSSSSGSRSDAVYNDEADGRSQQQQRPLVNRHRRGSMPPQHQQHHHHHRRRPQQQQQTRQQQKEQPQPQRYPRTACIHLRSVPLPFRAIFQQYFALGRRLRAHYLSPRVVLCLATGRFVPPLPRRTLYALQYSMLPQRRAGIREMCQRLLAPERQ